MAVKYTTNKFVLLYGLCNLSWDDVTTVQCTVRGEFIDVVTYYKDKVVSTFSIILHEDKWVLHGKYNWLINNRTKRYYKYGKLHRKDGPAIIRCFNGKKYRNEWCKNGKLHRKDGPACEEWYDNGLIRIQAWFLNGMKHRENGPAYIHWYNAGQLHISRWYYNDECHRIDGPAYSLYNNAGELISTGWWDHGKMYEPVLTKRAL